MNGFEKLQNSVWIPVFLVISGIILGVCIAKELNEKRNNSYPPGRDEENDARFLHVLLILLFIVIIIGFIVKMLDIFNVL